MKKLDIKTTTYSYTKEYLVDIVETEKNYEAYIYTESDSFKMFAIGCPKEQQNYKKAFDMNIEALTYKEFTEEIERCMGAFIKDYESMIYEEDFE